jgi:hypothetical protein
VFSVLLRIVRLERLSNTIRSPCRRWAARRIERYLVWSRIAAARSRHGSVPRADLAGKRWCTCTPTASTAPKKLADGSGCVQPPASGRQVAVKRIAEPGEGRRSKDVVRADKEGGLRSEPRSERLPGINEECLDAHDRSSAARSG